MAGVLYNADRCSLIMWPLSRGLSWHMGYTLLLTIAVVEKWLLLRLPHVARQLFGNFWYFEQLFSFQATFFSLGEISSYLPVLRNRSYLFNP